MTAIGATAVVVTAVRNDLKLWAIITSDLPSFSDDPCLRNIYTIWHKGYQVARKFGYRKEIPVKQYNKLNILLLTDPV